MCKTDIGLWSEIQQLGAAYGGARMLLLKSPTFTVSDDDNYVRCPCHVSVGKTIPGYPLPQSEGVIPTALSLFQKVSVVSMGGGVLSNKQVKGLFLDPPVHPAMPNPVVAAPNPVVTAPNPAVAASTPAVTAPNPAVAAPTPAVATPGFDIAAMRLAGDGQFTAAYWLNEWQKAQDEIAALKADIARLESKKRKKF